jgi:phosphatidate phosphatase APP1
MVCGSIDGFSKRSFYTVADSSRSRNVKERSTSLRGQITDQLGAVVVEVSVTITDANGKETATQTDSNGSYRFDNFAGGVYTLSAQQKALRLKL